MEGLGPVTLIVKAPNQKIEDRRVACDKSWTVRQLKEHLTTIYPEKPHRDQQKLVYYGKLLKDESCLHEVLKHETYDDAHTIHLVCPQHSYYRPSYPAVAQPRPASQASAGVQPTELRSRFAAQLQQPASPSSQPVVNPSTHMPHQQFIDAYMTQVRHWQESQTTLSPQQRLWIQAYQQQYSLFYMQWSHMMLMNGAAQLGNAPLQAPEVDVMPAAAPAPAAVNDNEVVQMNAQGGIDQDIVQHDWLDHLYTVIRLGMLVMLLYFYTTIGRFAVVLGAGIFFWLAQGNFRLQRRQAAPPAPQPIREQNQDENQNNENAERASETNLDENDSARNSQQPNEIQQNSSSFTDALKLILTFFVTFFSSLIPQNPAAVGN